MQMLHTHPNRAYESGMINGSALITKMRIHKVFKDSQFSFVASVAFRTFTVV